jgi:hypothetical protein
VAVAKAASTQLPTEQSSTSSSTLSTESTSTSNSSSTGYFSTEFSTQITNSSDSPTDEPLEFGQHDHNMENDDDNDDDNDDLQEHELNENLDIFGAPNVPLFAPREPNPWTLFPPHLGTLYPYHVLDKRAVTSESSSSSSLSTSQSSVSTSTSSSTDHPHDVIGLNDIPPNICDIGQVHKTFNLSSLPTVWEVDPLYFSVSKYPCQINGFAMVTPISSDCDQSSDHAVFHGSFQYKNITATCNCDYAMTDFPWTVSVDITNTSFHCRIHKLSNGKFKYFYNTDTYSHYNQVAAPNGDSHQIKKFLEKLHKDLKAHFENGFVHMANVIMKLISDRWH